MTGSRVARIKVLLGGCVILTLGTVASGGQEQRPVDYNREIRPILSRNCFACHGADDEHRKSGLRLDRREAAVKELDSGLTAIIPGKVDDSELVVRITTDNAAERMPPPSSGRELTEAEIATLKRWVAEGAAFAEHWSYVKPLRPALPTVRHAARIKNGIDNFILSRLEQQGLSPAPEADRYALARRLSLDLRGLPPTLEEVELFANDSSADAYEQLVERFLADPAFGERWARMWLDLARYADSKGLGSDPLRTIWRYRDWVIVSRSNRSPATCCRMRRSTNAWPRRFTATR
jgi:mono/diheme cytochrome c family protein